MMINELVERFLKLDDELYTEFLMNKLGNDDDSDSFIVEAVEWVESEKKRRERIKKIDDIL